MPTLPPVSVSRHAHRRQRRHRWRLRPVAARQGGVRRPALRAGPRGRGQADGRGRDVILAGVALALAALPALLYLVNLRLYRTPPVGGETNAISILIPARNEASAIMDAVEAALASRGVTLEVIVLDDHSTDATADLVR